MNTDTSLPFDRARTLSAHEAWHLLGLHPVRMGNRNAKLYNQACDHVANLSLLAQGFKPIEGWLCDPRFKGESVESVYKTLFEENPPQDRGSKGEKDGQNGAPSDESGEGEGEESQGDVLPAKGDAKMAEAKAKIQVEKALAVGRMAGNMPDGSERTIKEGLAPRHNWQETLNRFFTELTARDYSFTSPNKRFAGSGLVLPSLRSRDLGRVVLAVDTSGSVSEAEVSAMVAELQACLDAYSDAGLSQGLTVIYADSQVQHVETLFSGDKANPKGGGGTLFKPVFDYLDGNLDGAACLIYLTDGENGGEDLSSVSPSFPVLWGVITDNKAFIESPPCGEAFRLDVHA